MNINYREISKRLFSKCSLQKIKRTMPRTKKAWLVIILIILIVCAGLYFLLKPKTQEAPLPIVEVETVETADVNIYGEYVGRVRASQFVEVRARVEGYLEKNAKEDATLTKTGSGSAVLVLDSAEDVTGMTVKPVE